MKLRATDFEVSRTDRKTKAKLAGEFLGALRTAAILFVMSVRLSARDNSAPTGRIFMKFYI